MVTHVHAYTHTYPTMYYIYIYVYIYVYVYVYVYIYIYIYIYVYIYMYIRTNTYIHTYTYTHIYTYTGGWPQSPFKCGVSLPRQMCIRLGHFSGRCGQGAHTLLCLYPMMRRWHAGVCVYAMHLCVCVGMYVAYVCRYVRMCVCMYLCSMCL